MENEFLYKLNIDSNLSKVNEGLATFVKVGAGLTAFTGTAKLVANAFNEIDTLSVALGQDATYLRVIGQEFRLIGLSAQQGTGLVSNLSKEIRNISIGEGKLKELGMLGITDLDKIKTVQGFIGELRKSAGRDIEAFRTFAPKLGLDTGQIKYLLQEQETFKKNQQIARQQSVGTSQSIEEAKRLNESIAKLTASFERLGQAVLKLSTYLTPIIDTIGDSLFNLPENIGIISDKIGETIDDWFGVDENAKIPVEERKKINIKVRDTSGELKPIKTIQPIENIDKIDTSNIRPIRADNIGKDKISDMSNSRLEIYNEILNKNKDPNVSNVNNSKKIENKITINVATADDGDKILKTLNELNGE